MYPLYCYREYSDNDSAAFDIKNLLGSLPKTSITIEGKYGENIFKLEYSHQIKINPKIKDIITEKLQASSDENKNGYLTNSKSIVPFTRLVSVKMETSEFEALKNKIMEWGMAINETVTTHIAQSRL